VLTRAALDVVAGYLARTTARQRSRLAGLDELRARSVVAGSQVAALVMQAFGLNQLVLAPWALREGVILSELARRDPWPLAAPPDDPRQRRAVLDFARRHAWDEAHARQVTTLALSLFDQTSALHGLGPAERGLLEVAGLLHDVGYAVSQSAHHKHSLYLIRNADLDGFTPESATWSPISRATTARPSRPTATPTTWPSATTTEQLSGAWRRCCGWLTAWTPTTSRSSRRPPWSTGAITCGSSCGPATFPTWTCGQPSATATCSSWSSAATSNRWLSTLPRDSRCTAIRDTATTFCDHTRAQTLERTTNLHPIWVSCPDC
jgi:exopolyphosphatase/pppGpp-phosphohydrolase